MDTKKKVLKKIEKLQEEYDYWFEVFRREKNPKKKEDAKKKYKPAINEIIKLQEKYNIRVVPKHSSTERAKMDLDNKNKKLVYPK